MKKGGGEVSGEVCRNVGERIPEWVNLAKAGMVGEQEEAEWLSMGMECCRCGDDMELELG